MDLSREPIELERKDGVLVAKHSDDRGTPELGEREQLTEDTTNVNKETRRVAKTTDTLDRLLGTGRISQSQYEAGRKLERIFHAARFNRSDAIQWDRVPGQKRNGPEPDKVLDAKEALDAAMQALGGHGSPAAETVWHVVGHGATLKQYAQTRSRWTRRWQDASGALLSGLAILAKLWGR